MALRRELLSILLAAAFLLLGPGQALAAPQWLAAEPLQPSVAAFVDPTSPTDADGNSAAAQELAGGHVLRRPTARAAARGRPRRSISTPAGHAERAGPAVAVAARTASSSRVGRRPRRAAAEQVLRSADPVPQRRADHRGCAATSSSGELARGGRRRHRHRRLDPADGSSSNCSSRPRAAQLRGGAGRRASATADRVAVGAGRQRAAAAPANCGVCSAVALHPREPVPPGGRRLGRARSRWPSPADHRHRGSR